MSEKVKEGPYKNQKCIHCETFEQNHDDTKCQRRYPTLTDGTYVYMDSLRNVMGVGKRFDPEIEPFRCQVIDVPSIMRSSGFEQGRYSRDAEVAELRDKLKEAESKERLLKADLLNVTADRDNLKFMMVKFKAELDRANGEMAQERKVSADLQARLNLSEAKWEKLRATSFANRPDVLKKMEEIERGQVKPNGD